MIKYNSAGTLQWSVTGASGSLNPNSGGFRVAGVGADNAGNSYLVSNGSSGIVVVAYNPSGILLRSTILNTGGRSATARVMTVDGTGNVFIGGQVILSTANPIWAYMCARVSNGVQRYLSTFEGSANQFSYVTAITCDKSGNAYVTGTSTGAHTYITRTIFGPIIIRHDTSWDMATVKFDSSGNTSWANVYNAGINTGDFGFAVAVDPTSGNVYALGQSSGSSLLGDLIAYSSTASQLWINQSTNAPNNNAIAVDPSGNIITGGTSNFNVSKYSSAGALTWSYSNSSIAIYGVGPSDYLALSGCRHLPARPFYPNKTNAHPLKSANPPHLAYPSIFTRIARILPCSYHPVYPNILTKIQNSFINLDRFDFLFLIDFVYTFIYI